MHCLDWVPLCLSPLRSEWPLWLSASLTYMAYFATVVTPGDPEWALGRLVVLLSTPVTIVSDPALKFAHVFLQLRCCRSQYCLMPPHVICGWSMHTVGSKGNSARQWWQHKTSCLRSPSLLTLGMLIVQRRWMEALSRGYDTVMSVWMVGQCLFAVYTSSPGLCRLPLPQTPTVVPIPGNLPLLMEYLDNVSP